MRKKLVRPAPDHCECLRHLFKLVLLFDRTQKPPCGVVIGFLNDGFTLLAQLFRRVVGCH